MKVNYSADAGPQSLQRCTWPAGLAINRLEHLLESFFANGDQQVFFAGIVPVHGHGRTAHLRSVAAQRAALIPPPAKNLPRRLPLHSPQALFPAPPPPPN